MSIDRKPDTAVLFRDEEKTNEKGPDYTGEGLIGGETYRLAAWINEAKNSGKKYLSIKFEEPRQKQAAAPADPDLNEDAPF